MDSFETQYFEDRMKSGCVVTDEDMQHVENSSEETSAENECRTSLRSITCVTEINMKIQGTPIEDSNSHNSIERIGTEEKEISKLNAESISEKDIPQNAAVHLEILLSRRDKENNENFIEKSSEAEQRVKSQTPRRIFRGDSRDSGIGDCSSTNQLISSLQVDELGVASTIEEEVDYEMYNHENERISNKGYQNMKNQQSSTTEILASLPKIKKISLHESITSDGKVATRNDVTKTSCETNPTRKGVCKRNLRSFCNTDNDWIILLKEFYIFAVESTNENADARILGRNKFLPIGNVSRTAKIFERESGTSKSESLQIPTAQRAYSAAMVAGKAPNERIQKAFAFWNK